MIFKREDFQGLLDFGACAEVANSLLDAYLATLPVVYGKADEVQFYDFDCNSGNNSHTHRAILFDVKPVEKAECEHNWAYIFNKNFSAKEASKLTKKERDAAVIERLCLSCDIRNNVCEHRSIQQDFDFPITYSGKCNACGIKLKATWSPA